MIEQQQQDKLVSQVHSCVLELENAEVFAVYYSNE
jgi:hypothetical protein